MFSTQQFTGLAPSTAGTPRVPPSPPRNNAVIWPTLSASTAPGQLPGAAARPSISLRTQRFQPAAEPRRTDAQEIGKFSPLLGISYDQYDADHESDDSSDSGGAESKASISLKQTEFSLKQFAKRMGQPKFSTFNKWKKVWVAGFLEKKHRSIFWGQNRLKQLRDGPLHWEMVVADFLVTVETGLHLHKFDHAKWIWWQCVEMCLKKCASEIWESRKKGRRVNTQTATDLAECACKTATGNLPEIPNTTFIIVIRRVPNGNNDQTSSNQLQVSFTDVRHWEELIDFIEQNCSPKEPYCPTAISKCNLTQEELDEEYMGLYTPGQMMNDRLYGQISYNSSISNAFRLKLGHNLKLFLVEMKAATGKDMAEHVIRPAKVIPASIIKVNYAPLLISILRLGRDLMNMNEWWMRRQVGTRLTVEWM